MSSQDIAAPAAVRGKLYKVDIIRSDHHLTSVLGSKSLSTFCQPRIIILDDLAAASFYGQHHELRKLIAAGIPSTNGDLCVIHLGLAAPFK